MSRYGSNFEKGDYEMRKWLFIVILAGLLCGCQEEVKVWGVGDPDPQWIEYFGNDNGSRMSFMQTKTINAVSEAGVILAERVRVIEEQKLVIRMELLEAEWSEAHNYAGDLSESEYTTSDPNTRQYRKRRR